MTFHPRSRLRPKQIVIRNEIVENRAKLIVSGMGSGKTASTLTAVRDLLDAHAVRHVLVICPLLVATDVWPQEIEAWEHTRLMSYAVACGEEPQRAAAVEARAEITIINRENLVWLAKHIRSVRNWYWDMVVVDESSMFKRGQKRTQAAKVKRVVKGWMIDADGYRDMFFEDEAEARAFVEFEEYIMKLADQPSEFPIVPGKRKVTKQTKGGNMTRFGVMTTSLPMVNRVVELTGTPRPNGWEDMWGQIYLLDRGQALGRTKTEFLRTYFDHNKYTHEYTLRPGADEAIMKRIAHLVVSLPPDKLVPEPVYIPRKVTLPPSVMKEYRRFEKTLVSQEYDVEALSSGVLANKLLQFGNGSMYREDGSCVRVHNEKLKMLDALVEESEGENLLIFYGFKFDLDVIRERYPDAVVLSETPGAVADWNAGKIKMLLAHPASCAHGLNMQFGGHIAIWYGLTWSLELWMQANARLPRPGQTEIVAIYIIVAEGTYDEKCLESLTDKEAGQQKLIDGVTHWLFRS